MIKKLRLKFVLVFLVLAVGVFTVSSCYASTTFNYGDDNRYEMTIDEEAKTFYINDTVNSLTNTFDISHGLDNYSYYYITATRRISDGRYAFCVIFSNEFKWSKLSDYYSYINLSSTYLYRIYSKTSSLYLIQTIEGTSSSSQLYADGILLNDDDSLYIDTDSYDVQEPIYANHTIYGRADTSKIIYAPPVDTTFTYSFEGVKRGQVKLNIEDLDSSLKMYGYVGCENNFNVCDTLDTSSISSYLRLLSMYSDNSDLNCSLYEGEKLLYYIVDEDNVILDIGYISELAEGYFLYGFPVNDGVDFVFLNNGQVYWNNELTFKYQIDSGSLLTKNEIVSTGSYSYIESDKTTAKITYNGFVYDSNDEVIATAVTSTSNDLSSIYMKEVNTNYFETKIGLDILIYDSSCYWLQSIVLAGTDSSGNDIDFSNYSVRWSIPTWLTVDSIEIGTSTYDKYNGVITGFSSNGVLSIQLKITELLKNHTSDFDITLEIYNDSGDLVLTYIINSDDIVKNQILSEENNLDKPSYDIINNPNYTGGSGNKDFSNIQNWTSDDYLNLMSTDNFVWEFFKAILGNLPWWITVPITILIFGVVIITLIRFARGA